MLDLTIKTDTKETQAIRRGPWVLVAKKSEGPDTDIWNFSALRRLPVLPFKTRWTAISVGSTPMVNDPWEEYKKTVKNEDPADQDRFHVFPSPNFRGQENDFPSVVTMFGARTGIDISNLPTPEKDTLYGIEMPVGLDLWWNQTLALHFLRGEGPESIEDLADKAYRGRLKDQESSLHLQSIGSQAAIEKPARLFVHVERKKWGAAPLPNVFNNGNLCAEFPANPWHSGAPIPLMDALEGWIVFWGFSQWCAHLTKGTNDWRWQLETQPKGRNIRFHDPADAIARTKKAIEKSPSLSLPSFAKPAESLLYETPD